MNRGRKANPVAIGSFVILGTFLALVAVIIFGADRFFKRTERVVCYFSDSINGLDVGAPVKYKGVTIGKVDEISIRVIGDNLRTSTVSVFLSLDSESIKKKTGGDALSGTDNLILQIENGLRARLSFLSFVTGMIYVELDYFAEPNSSYKVSMRNYNCLEIPTLPSDISEMTKSIQQIAGEIGEIDFKGIANEFYVLLKNANEKMGDLKTKEINENLVATLENLNRITSSGKLMESIDNLNKLLADGSVFLEKTGASIDDIKESANRTLGKIDSVMDNVNGTISPHSPFMYNFAMFIRNVNDASLSIKNLTDFLERKPNSILTGRPNE